MTDFLDLSFTPMTCAAAAAEIAARPADAPFAYVVTPNVDHVIALSRDPGRAPLYAAAWRTLNDSRILELLAQWSGVALPVCPGSDLTAALFDNHIDPVEAVTIIGGSEAVIAGLQARYGLTDVRWHAPPMGLAGNPAAIARAAAFVAAHRSRFAFIAVGAPQQEMVARATHDRGDATGTALCVGASLEFLAGVQRRAPGWVQRARLEWAHRLVHDPGRLGERYLIEGPAILSLWLRWRHQRRAAMASRSSR